MLTIIPYVTSLIKDLLDYCKYPLQTTWRISSQNLWPAQHSNTFATVWGFTLHLESSPVREEETRTRGGALHSHTMHTSFSDGHLIA